MAKQQRWAGLCQIPEARISRSRCRFLLRVMRGESVPGFSPWLIDGGLLLGLHTVIPLFVSVPKCPLFIRTAGLINNLHLSPPEDPVSNQFPHSVCWGLGPVYEFRGTQFNLWHHPTNLFPTPGLYTCWSISLGFFFFSTNASISTGRVAHSILCFSSFLFTISLHSSQYFFQ